MAKSLWLFVFLFLFLLFFLCILLEQQESKYDVVVFVVVSAEMRAAKRERGDRHTNRFFLRLPAPPSESLNRLQGACALYCFLG